MAYRITEEEFNTLPPEEQKKYSKKGATRKKLKPYMTKQDNAEFLKEQKQKFKSTIAKIEKDFKEKEEKNILNTVYSACKKAGADFNQEAFKKFMDDKQEDFKKYLISNTENVKKDTQEDNKANN